jgi:hypothetical protein
MPRHAKDTVAIHGIDIGKNTSPIQATFCYPCLWVSAAA